MVCSSVANKKFSKTVPMVIRFRKYAMFISFILFLICKEIFVSWTSSVFSPLLPADYAA